MGTRARKGGDDKRDYRVHKSIVKGLSREQHDYLVGLMRQVRALRNEAIYLKGLGHAIMGYYPSYGEIYEQAARLDEYKALPTDIAQGALQSLEDSYTSTYAKWRNGDNRARVPRQQDPMRPSTIAFTNRVALKRGRPYILVPGKQNLRVKGETEQEAKARNQRHRAEEQLRRIPIPSDIGPDDYANVTEIKLVPRDDGREVELQLTIAEPRDEERPRPKTIDEATRVVTVDPGLDNTMTCTAFETREGEEAVLGCRIWDGRELKSRNERFNRRIAEINREIARLREERPDRWRRRVNRHYKALRRAYRKRDRMLEWLSRTYASRLVQWAGERGVEFVAFSWNDGFKLAPDMGRRTNRKFSQIPLARIRDAVRDACAKAGIGFGTFEESYTSKASALALDPVPTYGELSEEERDTLRFSGRRVRRGLYVVEIGGVRCELNADVNANLNQLEKRKPGSRRALMGRLGLAGLLAAVSRPERERLLSEGYASTGRRRKRACARRPSPTEKNHQSAETTLNKKPPLQERPQTL